MINITCCIYFVPQFCSTFLFINDVLIESLHPQALSTEANELLPIFNKTSSKFYRTPVPIADWSSQCGGGMATRQLSMSHAQGHRLPHGMEITHL